MRPLLHLIPTDKKQNRSRRCSKERMLQNCTKTIENNCTRVHDMSKKEDVQLKLS